MCTIPVITGEYSCSYLMPVPAILSVPAPIKPITLQLYTKILDIVFLCKLPACLFSFSCTETEISTCRLPNGHTLKYDPSSLARFQPCRENTQTLLKWYNKSIRPACFPEQERILVLHSSYLGEHGNITENSTAAKKLLFPNLILAL